MIPAKVELMRLVFMVSRFLVGFYRVIFSSGESRHLPHRRGNAYRTLGQYISEQFAGACCSKIYRRPEAGGHSNRSLIRKANFHEVVLQIAPADLCREPPAQLKFEAALYLVAPIRAVHRFSHNRPPFAVDFKR